MAKLVGGERLSIVTDHLGVPIAMHDAMGEEVWSAQTGTWGDLRRMSAGDAQDCPFRWPGQYEDIETGLYYNRFRYYDPEGGRYTSRDRLGLLGGAELYGYVARPLSHADPLGLTDIVYRALNRADIERLNSGQDLMPKVPTAGATPYDHVLKGSEPGYPGTQYISFTRERPFAERWAARSGTEVVEVDLDELQNMRLDLSTGAGRAEHLGPLTHASSGELRRVHKWARGAAEVLLMGSVPHTKIKRDCGG
jgi:RHS repeat-associated protein